jgi:ABC-type amino acid transport substrate-binding protein
VLSYRVRSQVTLQRCRQVALVPKNVANLFVRRAEVALLDLPTAMAVAHQSPDLEVPAQFATEEQYAVALPKDSANTEAVSTAIRAFATDGTLDDLIDTYLAPLLGGDPDDVRLITTKPAEG